MSKSTQIPSVPSKRRRSKKSGGTAFAIVAWIVALACLLPMVAVALAAATGGTDTIRHLMETVLAGYAGTTLVLVLLVAIGTGMVGVGAAWLVTMTRFPGVRLLEVVLVLPLAFPAYVLAYAYTFILDHPGIVQTTLREVTGWGPRDYWFPEIRSVGGAALMLVLVLYPYVYLLARAAFVQQSAGAFLAARALGNTSLQAFWRVSLPMARPAIASGVLLAVMETIADFGTVSYFGVQTFATGIYTSWFSLGDRTGAAQLALCLLGFALALALAERTSRGRARYHHAGKQQAKMPPVELRGGQAALAIVFCALPVLLGFVLPVLVLFEMGLESEQSLFSKRYLGFLQNSVTLAMTAAMLTVGAAICLGFYQRLRPGRPSALAGHVSRLGYAVPGGVIAVGLMVPFAAFDNALDAWMRANFEIRTGLLITGSIWLLVAAYMVRFMAAALGAYEGGQATLHANMDAAARSLGQGPLGMLRRVHLPILTPSLMTALLIVFVDVMKELPATLIMRPFNYDTLAVQAYRLASDERLEGAAVPSLVIMLVGLLPVILICRQVGRRH
ncbi:ABC transporter permease [Phaeobacter italicus]|jgi:iron(III) transport system permease protein|uniref:Putative 2-aminoethylphosphonate transport system permease protein PhnU n=1 Tax=Phaeobacter italicus TaxID=481446 RepID=A0A0H5DG92_9RHOB|nr:iron ABC transporter permease [Phaeobacter italicus]EEB72601.1 binding-protein-dependent transport systems inner membrane component [Ruegeria sp. R11]NKX41070.1 iron ABC transporter permease [Rhodobacteraceae bacterium R_SAG2]NKX71568.1 iron ABC transporter permease [Rhodobacteraceae bacterium R_SAG1]CRL12616.1 Putative 2-aminoethylphosphonate transport system permease protein PhnU [Phaeobacter italicus]CRL16357.1 Putative 2-aminoethylphosphonate transport system permease protein PhnU [Phae